MDFEIETSCQFKLAATVSACESSVQIPLCNITTVSYNGLGEASSLVTHHLSISFSASFTFLFVIHRIISIPSSV